MGAITSTLRTSYGYFRAFFKRRLGLREGGDSVEAIYNFHDISNLYATSGQPSEEQFQLISDDGYQLIINLAPTSVVENSVIDEGAIVDRLGMTYVHIPVDFKNPTDKDFDQFVATLESASDKKIWVHCAANMRVSAFTYRYRCQVLGEQRTTAQADLDKIWQPLGVWRQFVQD